MTHGPRPATAVVSAQLVRLPIWLILVVGLLSSYWYAGIRRGDVMHEARASFEDRSTAQAASLSTALRRNVDLATSAGGFVAGGAPVSNSSMGAWFRAVGPDRYAGLSGVGFVRRVAAAELPGLIAKLAADPVPLTAPGDVTLLPGGDRAEYCLIEAGVAGVGSTLDDIPGGLDLCALPDLDVALRTSVETGGLVQLPPSRRRSPASRATTPPRPMPVTRPPASGCPWTISARSAACRSTARASSR